MVGTGSSGSADAAAWRKIASMRCPALAGAPAIGLAHERVDDAVLEGLQVWSVAAARAEAAAKARP